MTGQYQAYNAEEWLSSNMHRNYPVIDDTIFRSVSGDPVPSSFLADLHIHVVALPEADAVSRFFVSHIVLSGSSVTVRISYKPASGSAFVCASASGISTGVTSGMPVAQRTFALTPVTGSIPAAYSSLATLGGSLIVGSCIDLVKSYEVDSASGSILPTCVSCSAAGVNSIVANGVSLSGDITIAASDGIRLSVENRVVSGAVEPTLVIERIPTEQDTSSPYSSVDKLYAAILEKLGSPVRTINGISPDQNGNIAVEGDDCTRVEPGQHSISLSNPCATPCCADYKTADIESAVESLESAKERLMEYYTELSNNVNALQAKLASAISNR